MTSSGFLSNAERAAAIPEPEMQMLTQAFGKSAVRMNEYYLKLIDWNDPSDPLRELVVPATGLPKDGGWDCSNDEFEYATPACQHVYANTALLHMPDAVRSRALRGDPDEALSAVMAGIDYIAGHEEIDQVLLVGGDSLAVGAAALRKVIGRLRLLDHVRIIRLHSKMPVFNPKRIYKNTELLKLIGEYSKPDRRIYVMAHVHHPREMTSEAIRAFEALHEAGAVIMSRTPLLKGVNDDSAVLGALLDHLSWAGVASHEFFINRPTLANERYSMPLERAYHLVEGAKARTSGPGKNARLTMSHVSGKIEILAVENRKAYLKYQQSRHHQHGMFMLLECPPSAVWFDDLPGSSRHWQDGPGAKSPKPFDDSPGDAVKRQAGYEIAD